ncbi:hypothetical protein E2320_020303 [Naja naja]|nr:hypothetical protein E2320_020303 [Naja naja]
MAEDEVSKVFTSESELLEELEKWKKKLEKIEKQKTENLLSKLDVDEQRKMKQKAVADLLDQSNKQAIERTRIQKNQQEQLFLIHEQNNKLRKEIEVLKMNLAAKKAKRGELRRSFSLSSPVLLPTFQLQQCLLEKKMKFVCLEEDKDENECTNMSCCFHVATKIPLTVNQGEALIQFEEEAGPQSLTNLPVDGLDIILSDGVHTLVAQQLIRKHNHIINLENKEVALKACPVALAMGTKFKTHVKLSQKAMRVSNIPNVDIAEEWMREKLELLFYKAKLGEIQSIIYDPFLQEATVTFCQPIALNEIIWHGQYGINVFGKTHFLTVSPLRQINVEKVQMFSGTSRKAVLLIGINAEQKDEENVEDMIEIHFQKPSNGGGEVDRVLFFLPVSEVKLVML